MLKQLHLVAVIGSVVLHGYPVSRISPPPGGKSPSISTRTVTERPMPRDMHPDYLSNVPLMLPDIIVLLEQYSTGEIVNDLMIAAER